MSNPKHGLRLEGPSTALPGPGKLKQNIDLTGGKSAADQQKAMAEKLAAMRRRRRKATPLGLATLGGLHIEVESASDNFRELQSPEAKSLQRALEHIEAGEFNDALVLLRSIGRDAPETWEAAYYVGMCEHKQGRPIEALQALVHARSEGSTKRLRLSELELRAEIRDDARDLLLANYDAALEEGENDRVDNALQAAIALDPDASMFYCLQAEHLVKLGRGVDALEVALSALERESLDEPDNVHQIMENVRASAAWESLADARDSYRARNFDECSGKLSETSPEIHETALYKVFRARVQQCRDGGFDDPPVAEAGPLDEFHFFISAPSLGFARFLLENDQGAMAVGPAEQAVEAAPHFEFAAFLLGVALERKLGHLYSIGEPPRFADSADRMRRVSTLASFAEQDPQITSAKDLRETADELVEHFDALLPLQPFKDGFDALMQSPDYSDLGGLQRQLGSVQSQVDALASTLAVQTAQEYARSLSKAMANIVSQIDDVRIISGLYAQLDAAMSSHAPGGQVSQYNVWALRNALQSVKSDAVGAKSKLKSEASAKPLSELISTVDRLLMQLGIY